VEVMRALVSQAVQCAGFFFFPFLKSKGVEAMRELVSQALQCAGFVFWLPALSQDVLCLVSILLDYFSCPLFIFLSFFWSCPSACLGSVIRVPVWDHETLTAEKDPTENPFRRHVHKRSPYSALAFSANKQIE
jgi:hypothetical protein